MDKNVKQLLVILALAAVLRLLLFVAIYPDQMKLFLRSDSRDYDGLAVNLARYRVFSRSGAAPFEPHVFMTPGYPLFLAFVYAVFGHKPLIALLFQILLDLISLLIVYKIGEILFTRVVGLISAGLLAVDVGQILNSNQLLSETLFILLFLLSIYCLLLFVKERQTRCGILAGLLLGMAAMVRPIVLYFPILLVITCAARGMNTLLSGLKRYSIVVLCFLLVVTPWLGRNYYRFGVPQFASKQGVTFHWYAAYLRAKIEGTTFGEAKEQIRTEVNHEIEEQNLNPLEEAAFYQRKAMREILQHPRDYAIVHLSGVVSLLVSSNVRQVAHMFGIPPSGTGFLTNFLTRGIAGAVEGFLQFCRSFFLTLSRSQQLVFVFALLEWAMLAVTYLLGVYGLLVSLRGKKLLAILTLGTVLVYFPLMTGPMGYARYRAPMMPYIYLLTAYGVLHLWRKAESNLKS